jgi:hypothetical protein
MRRTQRASSWLLSLVSGVLGRSALAEETPGSQTLLCEAPHNSVDLLAI